MDCRRTHALERWAIFSLGCARSRRTAQRARGTEMKSVAWTSSMCSYIARARSRRRCECQTSFRFIRLFFSRAPRYRRIYRRRRRCQIFIWSVDLRRCTESLAYIATLKEIHCGVLGGLVKLFYSSFRRFFFLPCSR